MIQMFTRSGEAVQVAEGIKTITRPRICGRCGGEGRSQRWAFTGFVCYDCGGERFKGVTVLKLYSAEKLASLNATQAKAQAKRQAKAEAAQAAAAAAAEARKAAFLVANAALIERAQPFMMTAEGQEPGFIARVMEKALAESQITEKQAAAVLGAIEKIEESARKRSASEWVGKIGQRLDLAVTVERVAEFPRPKFNAPWIEEMFAIVTMRTAEGAAIVVKSTSFWSEAGRQFTIRATVKEHTEFKGEKQTVVARVQIQQAKEQAA